MGGVEKSVEVISVFRRVSSNTVFKFATLVEAYHESGGCPPPSV